MIRLAGREPGQDIAIDYIGLRPGEKRYEELFYAAEDLIETIHPKIRIARQPGAPMDAIETALGELRAGVDGCDDARLARVLKRLVPRWPAPAMPALAAPPEPIDD